MVPRIFRPCGVKGARRLWRIYAFVKQPTAAKALHQIEPGFGKIAFRSRSVPQFPRSYNLKDATYASGGGCALTPLGLCIELKRLPHRLHLVAGGIHGCTGLQVVKQHCHQAAE